jgi:hypothetical protein
VKRKSYIQLPASVRPKYAVFGSARFAGMIATQVNFRRPLCFKKGDVCGANRRPNSACGVRTIATMAILRHELMSMPALMMGPVLAVCVAMRNFFVRCLSNAADFDVETQGLTCMGMIQIHIDKF